MTVDPRSALEQLIAALERHFEAANASRDPDHPMVVAAAQDLAEAFDDYDEALYDATEVATPLAIYGDDFDGHEDDEADGRVYAGLDSDEYVEDEDDEDDDEDDEDEDDDLDDELDDEEDDEDDEDDDLDDDDDYDDLDFEDDEDDEDDDEDDEEQAGSEKPAAAAPVADGAQARNT
jgi:pyruvate/2-oxoacid:ferredoxin oxidoreductase alpha subunit